ncbi:MAG: CBS domain-containing protein [Candidatus Nezhaarchaeales archaeon]
MRGDVLVEEIMRRDYVIIDTDKPVTYALRLMKKAGADGLVVVENDELVGLATYWDLMVRLGDVRVRDADVSSIYVSSIMEPVKAILTPESKVVDAARAFLEDPLHLIPVLKSGKLVGVIESRDVAKVLLDEEEPASNISLRNLPTVNVSARVVHARDLMINSRIRSLAALNERSVIGVVCDDQIVDIYIDLVLSAPMTRRRAQLKRLAVADVGPRRVKVDFDATLAQVAKLLLEKPVKGVPLVDSNNVLVGFVSIGELAKFVCAHASQLKP